MTSRKSDSASSRRPDSLRRSRALRRGCRYEPFDFQHIPYAWAAYRRGSFSHLPDFPDGLSPDHFRDLLVANVGSVFQSGGESWVFLAHTARGELPVGLIVAHVGQGVEPHVFWFPEASPRNKLECALRWIVDMKAKAPLFLWVKEPEWKFFHHLCKYGAIRPVGKYRDFPGGGDAMLFQGVT